MEESKFEGGFHGVDAYRPKMDHFLLQSFFLCSHLGLWATYNIKMIHMVVVIRVVPYINAVHCNPVFISLKSLKQREDRRIGMSWFHTKTTRALFKKKCKKKIRRGLTPCDKNMLTSGEGGMEPLHDRRGMVCARQSSWC